MANLTLRAVFAVILFIATALALPTLNTGPVAVPAIDTSAPLPSLREFIRRATTLPNDAANTPTEATLPHGWYGYDSTSPSSSHPDALAKLAESPKSTRKRASESRYHHEPPSTAPLYETAKEKRGASASDGQDARRAAYQKFGAHLPAGMKKVTSGAAPEPESMPEPKPKPVG